MQSRRIDEMNKLFMFIVEWRVCERNAWSKKVVLLEMLLMLSFSRYSLIILFARRGELVRRLHNTNNLLKVQLSCFFHDANKTTTEQQTLTRHVMRWEMLEILFWD